MSESLQSSHLIQKIFVTYDLSSYVNKITLSEACFASFCTSTYLFFAESDITLYPYSISKVKAFLYSFTSFSSNFINIVSGNKAIEEALTGSLLCFLIQESACKQNSCLYPKKPSLLIEIGIHYSK